MMTKQEVFRTVLQHLKQQGERAIDEEGRCEYHMPDGRKCAVGCLIPDDLYLPELEETTLYPADGYFQGGDPADRTTIDIARVLPHVSPEVYPLLKDLQLFHDDYWETDVPLDEGNNYIWLKEFAARYDLDVEEALR